MEERRHRSEQFQSRVWCLPWAGTFFQASAKALELAGHNSHRPIALVPEGSSLDRCVILNCGDSGVVQLHRTACITRFNVDCMRALS